MPWSLGGHISFGALTKENKVEKDKGHEAVDILQKNFEMELRHFIVKSYDHRCMFWYGGTLALECHISQSATIGDVLIEQNWHAEELRSHISEANLPLKGLSASSTP